jgi:DNA-binding transcriptional MerR regulator
MPSTLRIDISVKVKGSAMKIGELASRTGVSTRMLRHYEAQGLLAPGREANAYRTYDDADAERAVRVAGLVRAGVPTRLVKVLLDLENVPDDELVAACPRSVAELLHTELEGLDERIACLSRSRATLCSFLERAQAAAAELEPAPA